MKPNTIIYPGIAAMAMAATINPAQAQKNSVKPNIIYILADDLGYGDIACYGNKYIKTPNIDRIATEGILFTQHYSSAPVSAPARCGLLTGKNLGHSYVRNNREIKDVLPQNAGQTPIPDNTYTMAEMLKKSGYTTAIIGKWGLGAQSSEGAPNKQGFDFFYGYNDQNHAHNHFPQYLWRNDKQEFIEGNVETVHPKIDRNKDVDDQEYKKYVGKHYSLDLMTDEALKFIEQNRATPFFLYLTFVTPHKALQVPDETLEMYNGVFNETPYSGKGGYTPHPRPESAYASMITRMDSKIGEIMQELKKLGLDETTIVMFTSDNGPATGGMFPAETFNSTGGLRGVKGSVYEGGIREPFVARWPGKIKSGSRTDLPSAQYDLMATFAELTGQKLEETDGISFLPTLLGQYKRQQVHEYLYWEFSSGGGQYAVRCGNFKGVKMRASNPSSKWEVYDLSNDPGEKNDLSAQHPELISKFNEIVKKRTPSVFNEWNF
jgi:arylsulfatase A-like enzyme